MRLQSRPQRVAMSRKSMKRFPALLSLTALALRICPRRPPRRRKSSSSTPPALVRGKRVGLLTNQSGIDRHADAARSTARRYAGPEAGRALLTRARHPRRRRDARRVDRGREDRAADPFPLRRCRQAHAADARGKSTCCVYDIQDLGVRQYTFESTLALAMQAAPPKRGSLSSCSIAEPGHRHHSRGQHPRARLPVVRRHLSVLSRHGMTLGELARMYNAEQRIGADLTVVPIEGWRRDMWWDETVLPWCDPSPNIRRLELAMPLPRYGVLRGDEPCRRGVARICRSSRSVHPGSGTPRSSRP